MKKIDAWLMHLMLAGSCINCCKWWSVCNATSPTIVVMSHCINLSTWAVVFFFFLLRRFLPFWNIVMSSWFWLGWCYSTWRYFHLTFLLKIASPRWWYLSRPFGAEFPYSYIFFHLAIDAFCIKCDCVYFALSSLLIALLTSLFLFTMAFDTWPQCI